jgi:Mg2+ and Co2+ transporter CorA
MDGWELSELINQRRLALDELLTLGQQQRELIATGRMTELMRILSAKQQPIQRLTEIAQSLRQADHDDPADRQWPSEAVRQACRIEQQECLRIHQELLALEEACEAAMQANRTSIQNEINQLNASHQAAQHYVSGPAVAPSGGHLDLSD